jgi:two-component system chemotaxis response regulator CheB
MYIKNKSRYELLIIGGSAGSFPVVSKLLEKMPPKFRLPVVLCLHRLKDKREGFKEALEIKSMVPVEEPDDKSTIVPGRAFVAPANYHLLIESPSQFALATTELVQYSRPSIDVLFESAADVFNDRLVAMLLSGANRDGALGMKRVKDRGGLTIIQDPAVCSMPTMPEAALQATRIDHILNLEYLIDFIQSLN